MDPEELQGRENLKNLAHLIYRVYLANRLTHAGAEKQDKQVSYESLS
jgi:hypothetical protein